MDLSQANCKSYFLLDENIVYLNCANMSPMLRSVREAGLEAIETRAAPWKLSSEDWFKNAELLRNLAARIFQTEDDNIALIPSASYGLAAAAKNLKVNPGKSIIILENQFPSNFYVWENLSKQRGLRIVIVQKEKSKTLTESILNVINSDTAIIALPNCHWIEGTLIDLEKIRIAAKSIKAFLILDLSQSLGVLPIDIEKINPDFAVAVGYKWLLGPYGLGYMYVSPKWHNEGEPLEYSWLTRKGSDDFTSLTNYFSEYRSGARKFDMGEFSQFNLLPMSIAALKQILAWGIESIQMELKKMTDMLVDYKLKSGIFESDALSAGHLISIPFKNSNSDRIKNKLQENKVIISFRSSSIRVSPYLYNDKNDIEKLLSCLEV